MRPFQPEIIKKVTEIMKRNKKISKTEFNNFKTDGDALVDEIKFIDENRMRQ